MLKNVIEKALEAEMEGHLDESQRTNGSKRNGRPSRAATALDIDTPQDRQSSFEPELVKKRQTILADNLSDKIIGLYGLGMSYRDISGHIRQMYDTEYLAHRTWPDNRQGHTGYKGVAKPALGAFVLYRVARCHAL